MCTALHFKTNDRYFGRTLDNDCSFGEKVVITPRNFPVEFRNGKKSEHHYAIIGTALIKEDYPLYFDAVNEKGLCIAGLRFAQSVKYSKHCDSKESISVFELIPRLLCECKSVKEVTEIIKNSVIVDTPFSQELLSAPLHWMIADSESTMVLEAVESGIKIYDTNIGVLTNEPPFPIQLAKLNDYMCLSNNAAKNNFSKEIQLNEYSRGMGAIGLPGDLSSSSRFVRAAFFKLNSVCEKDENTSISQFFHILDTVSQPLGGCITENGKYETTVYNSCCNADKGIYYYTTYGDRTVKAVDLHAEDLEGEILISYNMESKLTLRFQNHISPPCCETHKEQVPSAF